MLVQKSPTQTCEPALPLQVSAEIASPTAEVCTGQHDLRCAGVDQRAQLHRNLLERGAAATPPHARNDAEAALLIAAVLDLQERSRAPRGSRRRHDPRLWTNFPSQSLDRNELVFAIIDDEPFE